MSARDGLRIKTAAHKKPPVKPVFESVLWRVRRRLLRANVSGRTRQWRQALDYSQGRRMLFWRRSAHPHSASLDPDLWFTRPPFIQRSLPSRQAVFASV